MTRFPLAHETWFHENLPTDWSFAGEVLTIAYLARIDLMTENHGLCRADGNEPALDIHGAADGR